MAITVGLDFGTHQTKICIENSDNPNHVTYEFFEWEPGVFALPSIIHINKDHTLSYGKMDMENVLWDRKLKHIKEPEKPKLPEYPIPPVIEVITKLSIPKEPTHSFVNKYGKKTEVPYHKLYGIEESLSNELYSYSKKNIRRMKKEYEYELDLYQKYGVARGYYKPRPIEIPTKKERNNSKDKYKHIDSNLVATEEQRIEYSQWKKKKEEIEKLNAKKEEENIQRKKEYDQQLLAWYKECQRMESIHNALKDKYEKSLVEYPMIFRYFKQATFSYYSWPYEIDSRSLSVLYLAYVIFLLEGRFGQDFSIQMGVPASKDTFDHYESLASAILIQAIRLVEEVFENDFEKFLTTPYEELLKLIPKSEYTSQLKRNYGLIILPEAYAALRSLSAHGRIEEGFGIMLDIGGGTSDLVFFNRTPWGSLHIYYYISIPKGLNYFLEFEDRKNNRQIDFRNQRDFEKLPSQIFKEANDIYESNVNNEVSSLIKFYIKDIQSRGKSKRDFLSKIRNRPVIYTGGGSVYSELRREIYEFTDVKHLNQRLLRIPNAIKMDKITLPFSVLAISYGLSVQVDDEDERILFPKDDLYATFEKQNSNSGQWYDPYDYGLADT